MCQDATSATEMFDAYQLLLGKFENFRAKDSKICQMASLVSEH